MGDLLKFVARSSRRNDGQVDGKTSSGGNGGDRVLDFGSVLPLAAGHDWVDISSEEYLAASNMDEPRLLIDKGDYRVWAGRRGEGVAVLIFDGSRGLLSIMSKEEFRTIREELGPVAKDYIHCLLASRK